MRGLQTIPGPPSAHRGVGHHAPAERIDSGSCVMGDGGAWIHGIGGVGNLPEQVDELADPANEIPSGEITGGEDSVEALT